VTTLVTIKSHCKVILTTLVGHFTNLLATVTTLVTIKSHCKVILTTLVGQCEMQKM